ncbi:unnamed protein product [Trichogramma brassicae]|uniref:Uncharacterized protein n=1 Tax=Trichogramma brassicae TaxID=86971 RepID=A0A6H5IIF8_9HYME|nr:unnamed protein product [Trichogramma brassicae]
MSISFVPGLLCCARYYMPRVRRIDDTLGISKYTCRRFSLKYINIIHRLQNARDLVFSLAACMYPYRCKQTSYSRAPIVKTIRDALRCCCFCGVVYLHAGHGGSGGGSLIYLTRRKLARLPNALRSARFMFRAIRSRSLVWCRAICERVFNCESFFSVRAAVFRRLNPCPACSRFERIASLHRAARRQPPRELTHKAARTQALHNSFAYTQQHD